MDEAMCLTQDPALIKIQSFVSSFENAVGQGQALDVDPNALAAAARGLVGAALPPSELKAAGHRLWEVCATAAAETPPLLSGQGEAAARELACELIETAMTQKGTWQPADCFDLILQWAVTGKVWLDLAEHAAAVRCLSRSSATWDTYAQDAQDADVERLGEVALQTQLWMSTAMTQLGNHDQAFVVLSKAAGMLKKSPAPAAVSQGLLLRTCMEQAAALRENGSTRLAADTLMLACTALPTEGSFRAGRVQPERADLLRQLALCNAELHDHSAAVVHAREAVRLEAPGSSGHARSLQALLLALCAPGGATVPATSAHGGVEDMGEAALGFVAHKRAKLADCLDICRDLADRGLDATFLACLARLRARLKGGDPGQLGATWVLGAQVLASRIEEAGPGAVTEAGETAVDALSELLDEVEAAPGRPPELGTQLSNLLWGLSMALCQQGRPLAATTWLHRALPFLSEEGHAAAAWRVLAACHFKAGEVDHARRCADTALAHDPADAHAATLALIHAVSRGDTKAAQGLLARARAQELRLSGPQGAFLLQEITKQPPSALHLQCLELLLDTSVVDPDAAQEAAQGGLCIVPPQRLLRMLLDMAEACNQPESRLVQYLDKAVALVDADPTWFGEFAWSHGVAFARQSRWSSSVTMFERAHVLLGRCDSRAAAAQAQCVLAIVQSLLRAARCEERGLEAQQLRQQAIDWAQRARGGGDAATAQALAQLHFEALCFLHSPVLEGAEGEELRELAAPAPQDAARLARIAVEAGNVQQAVRCLRAYIQLSGANVAAARRQLVNLCFSPHDHHSLIEEAACVCQEALSTLSGTGSFPAQLPEKEVLWLATVVWNAGVELLLERREVALRLTGLGLGLLDAAGKLADDGGRISNLHAHFQASLCALGEA